MPLNDLLRVRTMLGLASAALLASAIFVTIPAMALDDRAVQEVEVQEYQGEKLASVDDFRDNSIRGVQRINAADYELRIDGLVSHEFGLSYEQLQTMSHILKLVTLNCVEGWSVNALWDGIPLTSLLEQVVPTTEANTVIFHAADGYTSSLPLDYIIERNLIIADRINGITLPEANGFPFQLVAEAKWGYKWIKWITRIELSNDPSYRGFWESRGYNNNGDLSGSKYE